SYRDKLLCIATEENEPHVLMQYFAARALSSCIALGKLAIPANTLKILEGIAKSPYPCSKEKNIHRGGFYQGRPQEMMKPSFEFHLDYDFHKNDVESLSHVFNAGCWEVADMMSSIVENLDHTATSMYQSDGRQSRKRDTHRLTSS